MKKYTITNKDGHFYKKDGTPFLIDEFKGASFVAMDLENGTYKVLKDKNRVLSTQIISEDVLFMELI